MWYVIKVSELSELRAIAWERDPHKGYVGAVLEGAPAVLTLEHRTASRLCSAMNAEIKRAI